MRVFFSIKAKILCVIFIVFVLQMVFSASSLHDTYNEYKRLRIMECQQSFDAACQKMGERIALLEHGARHFAQFMERHSMRSEQDRADAATLLGQILTELPYAVGGGLWFEPYGNDPAKERSCLYLFRKNGVLRVDPSFEGADYDYPRQKWYTTIKERAFTSRDTIWSAPYRDASGTHALMTTVGCGLFRDNRFFGSVTIDWDLTDVMDRVLGMLPTRHSFAVFADLMNNVVLARSDMPQDTAFGSSVSGLPWMYQVGYGQTRITLDGVAYRAFMKTLDNDTALVLNVPEDELMAPVRNRMLNMLAWVVGFTLVLLGATRYLLDRFISTPLVSIVREAEYIGHGDLDRRVTVADRGELGELAGVLNRMVADLKRHIEETQRMAQEKERISAELDVATHIQASMLPCIFPPYPNRQEFDLFAEMRPAREVGGDFYDFFLTDEEHLAFIIADVSGKGVPAALFMVIAKILLQNYLQSGLSPAQALEAVNSRLCENNTMDMFVTVWAGVLTLDSGVVRYANAGHNNPLFCRAQGGVKEISGRHGFVLGGMEGMRYVDETFRMERGDRLLLYTDGVTETENGESVQFGMKRLQRHAEKLQKVTLEKEVSALFSAVDAFAGGIPQFDDITLLVLEYRGSDPRFSVRDRLFRCTLPAEMAHFEALRNRAEMFLEQQGIRGKAAGCLLVAIEELYVNIVCYAYSGGEGNVCFEMRVQDARRGDDVAGDRIVVCRFRDRGLPFNPLAQAEPDVTLGIEERREGGLGIFLARKLMDNTTYTREADENVLTFMKRVGAPA